MLFNDYQFTIMSDGKNNRGQIYLTVYVDTKRKLRLPLEIVLGMSIKELYVGFVNIDSSIDLILATLEPHMRVNETATHAVSFFHCNAMLTNIEGRDFYLDVSDDSYPGVHISTLDTKTVQVYSRTFNLDQLKSKAIDSQGHTITLELQSPPKFFKGNIIEYGNRFLEVLRPFLLRDVMTKLIDEDTIDVDLTEQKDYAYILSDYDLNVFTKVLLQYRYVKEIEDVERSDYLLVNAIPLD